MELEEKAYWVGMGLTIYLIFYAVFVSVWIKNSLFLFGSMLSLMFGGYFIINLMRDTILNHITEDILDSKKYALIGNYPAKLENEINKSWEKNVLGKYSVWKMVFRPPIKFWAVNISKIIEVDSDSPLGNICLSNVIIIHELTHWAGEDHKNVVESARWDRFISRCVEYPGISKYYNKILNLIENRS